jgi:uncharacterized cupredoxin-like copper-binding protein
MRIWASFVSAALAAGLPALAADPWASPEVVSVTMVDDRFEPSTVAFHSGKPTELRLRNTGKELHEFTAAAFFRAARVRDPRQLANGGTEIVLQPGTSVRVLLIPGKPGSYALTCADHDWAGMVGTITVQ